MPSLNLKFIGAGDNAWPDLKALDEAGKLHHVTDEIELAFLVGGMESGAASVSLRIPLPDGTVVFAETSARLFQLAAAQLTAGIEREEARRKRGEKKEQAPS